MKLSIVFPCKNQMETLIENLKNNAIPYFNACPFQYEIIVNANNCNDENIEIMNMNKKYFDDNVIFLEPDPIRGKGRGVARGIKSATGNYVIFMDSDFATNLHALDSYIGGLINDEYDCLIGSRHMKGSVIENKAPWFRRIMSWGSRTLIKMMFHIPVHDTQCGYKLFKTSIANQMIEKQITTEFAFDIEYLYFYKLNGFDIKEIPVIWTDDPDSSIKSPLKTSWKFFKDMIKIRNNKKAYLLTEDERIQLERRD